MGVIFLFYFWWHFTVTMCPSQRQKNVGPRDLAIVGSCVCIFFLFLLPTGGREVEARLIARVCVLLRTSAVSGQIVDIRDYILG